MNLTYIILFILIHRVIVENKWLTSHLIDEETNTPKGSHLFKVTTGRDKILLHSTWLFFFF